jgi:hypothetical protein
VIGEADAEVAVGLAAVVAMRDEMISRCLSKSTRAELTCGLAATSSADMTKCEGKT